MPTTISNPASFSSVRSAFSAEGYGSSTSFFAYRQGGGIVPATSAFNVIGAGSAGDPLRLSQFSGFTVPSPVVISIASDSISSDAVFETSQDVQSASYGILANGLIAAQATTTTNATIVNGITNGTNWVTPTSAASNYEVRATKVSGVNPSGLLNTWLPCTSDRYWTVLIVGQGQESSVLTIEIRDAATGTILDTATPVSLFVRCGA
jgi:hypothetical protein